MKRIFLIAISTLLTLHLNAQKVTQFMGIPVDGTKSKMIQKLEQKGFEYNSYGDYLTGEFNGRDVQVFIVTNRDKVRRIYVVDKYGTSSVSKIKNRFNTLCYQFENNLKYYKYTSVENNQQIADDEDISYEITVNDKQYEAVFYQISNDELVAIEQDCTQDRNINDTTITEEQRTTIINDCVWYALFEVKPKYSVWFTIHKSNGEYTIGIYYDNGYNEPNGEDL